MKALMWAIKSFRLPNEAPASALAAKIENQIFDLIEPEPVPAKAGNALVGVKWKWTFG